jgi:hypothetical protein
MSATGRRVAIARLARKLDAIALPQLRHECARLIAENERLRADLEVAERVAESWRDDALRMQNELCASSGGSPGITVDGTLLVVAPISTHHVGGAG